MSKWIYLTVVCGLFSGCASDDGPTRPRTAEERADDAREERLKRKHGAIGGTFIGIGGDLEEFFTGNRTVDQ